jgi:hypothetical protein
MTTQKTSSEMSEIARLCRGDCTFRMLTLINPVERAEPFEL